MGAPYPASLYAEQNQPSRAVMEYVTTSDAARPPEAAMRNVARGGSRRKHRRGKRSHTRRKHGTHGKHGKRHARR